MFLFEALDSKLESYILYLNLLKDRHLAIDDNGHLHDFQSWFTDVKLKFD